MVGPFRKKKSREKKNSCATILWPKPQKKWTYKIQNKTCGSAGWKWTTCRLHRNRNHYVHSLITTGMCIEGGNTSAPRDSMGTNKTTISSKRYRYIGISYILNVFFWQLACFIVFSAWQTRRFNELGSRTILISMWGIPTATQLGAQKEPGDFPGEWAVPPSLNLIHSKFLRSFRFLSIFNMIFV